MSETLTERAADLCGLPPLAADARDALRRSIRAEGIHTPVVRDQHGRLIDGVERVAVAGELNLRSYPVRTVHCPDERTFRHLRLELNCNRRQLDRRQRREIISRELSQSPDLSDRFVASLVGVSHRTVAAVRAELEATGQIARMAATVGRDGRRRRLPVIPTETRTEADRAAEVLRALADPPPRPIRLQVEHTDVAEVLHQSITLAEQKAKRGDVKASALLTSRNLEEAAKQAGIAPNTLLKWMKDPEFDG